MPLLRRMRDSISPAAQHIGIVACSAEGGALGTRALVESEIYPEKLATFGISFACPDIKGGSQSTTSSFKNWFVPYSLTTRFSI